MENSSEKYCKVCEKFVSNYIKHSSTKKHENSKKQLPFVIIKENNDFIEDPFYEEMAHSFKIIWNPSKADLKMYYETKKSLNAEDKSIYDKVYEQVYFSHFQKDI